jgi:hypothetical protein
MAPIELKGGLIVDTAALGLALELEAAGITLTGKDGVLTASPKGAVTDEQITEIRRWKRHLLAIAGYQADAS